MSQPAEQSKPDQGPCLIILGTGSGATALYSEEASSAFVLTIGSQPVLLADLGLGVVKSCLQHTALPDLIYISHNHTDHAGELPPLLANIHAGGLPSRGRRNVKVLAHPQVLERLLTYRLNELNATGKPLTDFATFVEIPDGPPVSIHPDVSIKVLRSRHSELCYGLLVFYQGSPLLGWSADSGYDAALYAELACAPTLLLDARAAGGPEHSSFAEVAVFARKVMTAEPGEGPRVKQVLVTGYGRQSEAPALDVDLGGAVVARPGLVIPLSLSGS